MPQQQSKSILLVGASRGLGEAMAHVFVARGWRVVGTVRNDSPNGLRELARDHPDQVGIERLDIIDPDQIAPTCEENLEAIRSLAQWARERGSPGWSALLGLLVLGRRRRPRAYLRRPR